MTIASEVEVKQVRLVKGTGSQISSARQAGEILDTDLVVQTDAPEPATAEQGALADTALQPGDNITELVNNADYATNTQVGSAISTHNTNESAHSYIQGLISSEESRAEGVEGTLSNLTTDVKNNLVSAINEVDSHADTNASDISGIKALIPNDASTSNQLADKQFVNSSIATNTANFIGTFNSVADLEAYSGTLTNNDYAFVVGTDTAGNTVYDRYKYTDATTPASWVFEYELNNSSFTADQWAAINSLATAGKITQITTNQNAIGTLSSLTTTAKTNLVSAVNELNSNKVNANSAITGATKCKITYDSKGLVTGGADLSASDIPSLTLSKISDVTATASEVNVLDGITASTSELNVLDGITASTTELNYVDGVTSSIQTQLNGKVPDTRKVNNKVLSSDITLTASDVGALPDSTVIPTLNSTTNVLPVRNSASSLTDSQFKQTADGRSIGVFGEPDASTSYDKYFSIKGGRLRTYAGGENSYLFQGYTNGGANSAMIAAIMSGNNDAGAYMTFGCCNGTNSWVGSGVKNSFFFSSQKNSSGQALKPLKFIVDANCSGTPQIVIATNKKVGIKTENPSYDLDVSGTINASTDVKVNGNSVLTGINSSDVTTALGYTPYNSSNPAGYISGITSAMVTTALGYTPYNSTNPNGYQANVLEGVQVNGTDLTITNKKVNVLVPTQASDIGAQPTLVSGTNIKTVNSQSLLGSGNIEIQSAPDVDNKSISLNLSDELQTIGVIDQNNTSTALKQWSGTKAQYDALEKENWYAWDVSGTTYYTKSATPQVGDVIYDSNKQNTGKTVSAVSSNTISWTEIDYRSITNNFAGGGYDIDSTYHVKINGVERPHNIGDNTSYTWDNIPVGSTVTLDFITDDIHGDDLVIFESTNTDCIPETMFYHPSATYTFTMPDEDISFRFSLQD